MFETATRFLFPGWKRNKDLISELEADLDILGSELDACSSHLRSVNQKLLAAEKRCEFSSQQAEDALRKRQQLTSEIEGVLAAERLKRWRKITAMPTSKALKMLECELPPSMDAALLVQPFGNVAERFRGSAVSSDRLWLRNRLNAYLLLVPAEHDFENLPVFPSEQA